MSKQFFSLKIYRFEVSLALLTLLRFHFTITVENGNHFDYKLKTGNLKTTNAVRILELNNYPKKIIEEAKMVSKGMQKVRVNLASTSGVICVLGRQFLGRKA